MKATKDTEHLQTLDEFTLSSKTVTGGGCDCYCKERRYHYQRVHFNRNAPGASTAWGAEPLSDYEWYEDCPHCIISSHYNNFGEKVGTAASRDACASICASMYDHVMEKCV